jgi:hypothetical protein
LLRLCKRIQIQKIQIHAKSVREKLNLKDQFCKELSLNESESPEYEFESLESKSESLESKSNHFIQNQNAYQSYHRDDGFHYRPCHKSLFYRQIEIFFE